MPGLALGTVQFGLDYGVANRNGRVAFGDVKAIIAEAAQAGVDVLDTAIVYGDAEATLGRVGVADWRVVTKLPPIPPGIADVEVWAKEAIDASLDRLKLSRLAGVLLHHPTDLLGPNGSALQRALEAAKLSGRVEKLGVSIYHPEELEAVLPVFSPGLVQAPLNILDRRLVASGWTRRLKDIGTEIHCRSAFLQGLLLMKAQERPNKFARWQRIWAEWDAWLDASGLSAVEACLAYALGESTIDRVVVGVDSLAQLREIIAASTMKIPALPDWSGVVTPELINPSHWNQL